MFKAFKNRLRRFLKRKTNQYKLLQNKYPNTVLEKGLFVTNHSLIKVGDRTKINRGVNLIVYGNSKSQNGKSGLIEIGENCLISYDTKIFAGKGKVIIGDHVEIGMNCFISAQKRVVSRKEESQELAIVSCKTVIGDECLLASGCFIIEGSKLGNNCIVAAGAVVSGNYASNTLLVGNPARPIPRKD